MRRPLAVTLASSAVLLALATASAQNPSLSPSQLGLFVYPAKGQTPQQQQGEEAECYGWARQQTGIDPMAPPPAPQQAQSSGPDGSAIKGGAKGAAVGTAIGAIAGDTGEGAAIGAVAGAVHGRRQAKRQKQAQQQQAEQQAQAQAVGTQQTFNKAFGACLEGKGYSVK
jgi:hypothetical protein